MLRIKGVGPLYGGYESWSDEQRVLSWSWFRELTPPWRMGHGIRFRVGHRAVQVGLCRKRPLAPDPTPLSQLGGFDLDATPEQIGAWGRDAATEEPDPAH